jgi:hypothetical protein
VRIDLHSALNTLLCVTRRCHASLPVSLSFARAHPRTALCARARLSGPASGRARRRFFPDPPRFRALPALPARLMDGETRLRGGRTRLGT